MNDTPRTDSKRASNPFYVKADFARQLERELAAVTAERDALKQQKRGFSDKLAQEVIAGQVKRIAELETKLDGWFVERDHLRAALEKCVEALERIGKSRENQAYGSDELTTDAETALGVLAQAKEALK